VAGTSEDVCDVMNALKDKGRSEHVILLLVQETQDMQSICLICNDFHLRRRMVEKQFFESRHNTFTTCL